MSQCGGSLSAGRELAGLGETGLGHGVFAKGEFHIVKCTGCAWGDCTDVFLVQMEEVLWHKFSQHPDLRTMLLKTGHSHLVYADPQDPYWGSGAQYGQAGDYHGSNYLGKLLEKVRERLRAEG